MFDRKFVLGILMGGILGLTVAGLQPLRSPALAQAPSSDAALLREVQAIRQTLLDTPGVAGVHDLRTRKMGDMVVVDAHLEVDAQITVEEGHDIAVEARQRVMQRHRVLNLMTHVDPWRKPDRDHTVQPR